MNRKPIFDIVRQMLGRKFRSDEIAMLNRAVDQASEVSGSTDAEPVTIRRIGQAGITLIKQFEGCAKKRSDGMVEAYPDPGTGGDPWTIGWGATGHDGKGGRIAPGTVWTQAQCDARLESDLKRYAGDVSAAIGDAPTTQSQFDALVSFHYNTGAIAKATLTKRHTAGDSEGAAAEFERWKFAGGRVLKGLQRRRETEAKLYRGQS